MVLRLTTAKLVILVTSITVVMLMMMTLMIFLTTAKLIFLMTSITTVMPMMMARMIIVSSLTHNKKSPLLLSEVFQDLLNTMEFNSWKTPYTTVYVSSPYLAWMYAPVQAYIF